MANRLFGVVAEGLEEESPLDRLEARGTLRIALKEAGLEPARTSVEQMIVVLRKVLPGELETRGISDGERVCEALIQRVRAAGEVGGNDDGPEDVFGRFGA